MDFEAYKDVKTGELLELFVDLTVLLEEERERGRVRGASEELWAVKPTPELACADWVLRLALFESWLRGQLALKKLELRKHRQRL